MKDTAAKLRRLAEVELMRAEIEARKVARRVLWTSVAVLIGLLALGMLSFAVFLALANAYGNLNAALIVGGVLTVLAAAALVYAIQAPGRTAQLESEILARSVEDARENLREDFEELEDRFDQVTDGLARFLKGDREPQGLGTASGNMAAITMILSAISALSPTLRRYIQPLLKIIS
ncbi:MAG TPA: phage holin family protein [Parvibaculum sp.]|jgi:type VI protein secretion system component VasK